MSLIRAVVASAAMLVAVPAMAQAPAKAPAKAPATTQLTAEQKAQLNDFIQQVRAGKRQLVTDNLKLTPEEGNKFWPIYEQYQSELQAINKRTFNLVKAYADAYNAGPVADAKAKELLAESLAIDESELKLRKTYTPKIEKALPAAKAARYIQIEQKIRAAIKYELASGIPLVE